MVSNIVSPGAQNRVGWQSGSRSTILKFGFLLILLLVAPFVVYPIFAMKVLCFALFASAFNLLLGYGGLLSFGHAAFFGSASYIAAYSAKSFGMTPEASILIGAGAAGILGLIFGSLAIRRQGIYFAMVTLALAQMVYFVALQAPFTGGEDGIQAIPRGALLGAVDLSSDASMYAFVATVFFIGLLIIHRIVNSPFGRVLHAIRENEARAISMGYEVQMHKLILFVLSAVLSGMAGGMKAIVFQLASLTDVFWTMSGEVVLMTLIGGVATFFGPLVGASVVVALQNYLADFGSWVTVTQGAIFVACVLLFRKGIVGLVIDRWTKRAPVRQA